MKKIILFILLTLLTLHTQRTLSQWVQQQIPVAKPITGLKFIDTLNGWACTSYGSQQDTAYIIHTTNGGTNWFVQLKIPSSSFSVINIVDNFVGYAACYDNSIGLTKLFNTTNGGNNWNYNIMVPNLWIDDMQYLNKDSAWECGLSAGPDVRTTTDGGLTWTVRTNGFNQTTQKLFFLNYNTGFCGANGVLFKTTNTGLNWASVHSFGSDDIYGIFFKNLDTGWLGLNEGKIGSTTNGGDNWLIQQPDPLNTTQSTDIFISKNVGWVGTGEYRSIFKTKNYGLNWGYQTDTSGCAKISFIDTSFGWTGYSGISHTSNGGGQITYVGIINKNNKLPKNFKLFQNYPNPFNSQTTIRFSINKSLYVKLKIYDIQGKEMNLWESGKLLDAGTHEFNFDAGNLASGVYFYQLTIINEQLEVVFRDTKKMILIK